MAAADYSTVTQELYVAYFGRPADVTGFANFEAALNNAGAPTTIAGLTAAYSTNTSIKTLVDSFGTSAESTALYGSGSTISFVNAIYQNLLNRSPDVAGLTFWANAIDSGTLTKGNASAAIMAGALANTTTQGVIDAACVTNKVTVAGNFTTALDTTAEILAYDGATAAATARTMLSTVTNTTDTTAFQTTVTSTVSDLVTTYNTASVAGSTFTLTTTVDTFTGTAKNDTFNTTADSTFTQLDSIDGGAGSDTLNIAATNAFTGVPTGSKISNVETVNITGSRAVTVDTTASNWSGVAALNTTNSGAAATVTAGSTTAVAVTDTAQAANAITVNGGSTVAVTATGATTGGITVGGTTAAAGAVTVSSTAQAMGNGVTGGAIAVTGGTTVAITSTTAGSGLSVDETATQGTVTVNGNANTTSVSVIQSGIVEESAVQAASPNVRNAVAGVKGNAAGGVTITDANGASTTAASTITSVTLQNYGTSTITSNALSTLTLSGTGVDTTGTAAAANKTGDLTLNDSLTTKTVTALTLNLGGGYVGGITDAANKFTTVNAVLTANTKLDGFTDTALRTLAISGTGVLSLVNANTALTSVTVSGAAGLTADLSSVTGITSFTAANTTANNTVRINATTQTYTGGSGNDKVAIVADATKVITGGSGTDTLVLGVSTANTAATVFTLANTGTNVTGFEVLQAQRLTGTLDMNLIGGSVFTKIQIGNGTSSDTTTFTKVASGTALELLNTTTSVTYQTSDASGDTDTVNLTLTGTSAASGTGTVGYTTTALTLKDAANNGIATLNVVTDATVGGGVHTITTLTDAALKSLAITGTGALVIGNLTTSATSFTLSDNDTSTGSSAITTLTAASLANLSYSGTHAFSIATLASNTVPTLTITNANTGSTGVLTVGSTGFTNDTLASLTLNGAVKLTGSFGLDGAATFSGATDNQNVSITAIGGGVKTITLGNGDNNIVTGAGADVITLGTGANTVNAGAGGDKVTFGAHNGIDTVTYSAISQTKAGSVTSGTTALTAANGYDIYTGLQAGDKIDLQALTVDLFTAGSLGTTINGATAGAIEIVRGNYVASTGIFTTSSTGADSIVQWNNLGTGGSGTSTQETIVLVGFVNTASATTIDGLITLA